MSVAAQLRHSKSGSGSEEGDLFAVAYPIRGDIDELLGLAAQEAASTRMTALAGPRSRT